MRSSFFTEFEAASKPYLNQIQNSLQRFVSFILSITHLFPNQPLVNLTHMRYVDVQPRTMAVDPYAPSDKVQRVVPAVVRESQ